MSIPYDQCKENGLPASTAIPCLRFAAGARRFRIDTDRSRFIIRGIKHLDVSPRKSAGWDGRIVVGDRGTVCLMIAEGVVNETVFLCGCCGCFLRGGRRDGGEHLYVVDRGGRYGSDGPRQTGELGGRRRAGDRHGDHERAFREVRFVGDNHRPAYVERRPLSERSCLRIGRNSLRSRSDGAEPPALRLLAGLEPPHVPHVPYRSGDDPRAGWHARHDERHTEDRVHRWHERRLLFRHGTEGRHPVPHALRRERLPHERRHRFRVFHDLRRYEDRDRGHGHENHRRGHLLDR